MGNSQTDSFPQRPFGGRKNPGMGLLATSGALVALVLWVVFWGPSWADEGDLVWSTFLGGGQADYGYDIALDSSGCAWVTGYTESIDFPTTAGALDSVNDGRDVFVVRIDHGEGALCLSTFLGGGHWEEGFSIALDAGDSVYLTGYTRSEDFPVTDGALDTIMDGDSDAFVVKLEPAGGVLGYSTLLGGGGDDDGLGIAVDGSGQALVIGTTGSVDFPVTAGAFDQTHNGGVDVFVARLSPPGSALDYATFLGGSFADYGWGIAPGSSGAIHVVGYTYSSDFPTTDGAFDTLHNGPTDVFVAKFDPCGSDLSYSTFLGGDYFDGARSIAVDGSGSAHVTGYTFSQDFPVTAGALDTTLSPFDVSAFAVKLSPSGSALSYATFLGGDGTDSGYGIVLDSSGNACVIGFTESEDFPTTLGALNESLNGERDVFLSLLNPTGSMLQYSTYLGGADDDYGWDVVLDGLGHAQVTGYTRSVDFPTTAGAFDATHNGGEDVFVVKLLLGQPVLVEATGPPWALPERCVLAQNYPNPFNANTQIPYRLSRNSHVTMKIFNSLGQKVRTLVDAGQRAGRYTVLWDGRDAEGREVASGLYFCRLGAGDFDQTIKMVLVK